MIVLKLRSSIDGLIGLRGSGAKRGHWIKSSKERKKERKGEREESPRSLRTAPKGPPGCSAPPTCLPREWGAGRALLGNPGVRGRAKPNERQISGREIQGGSVQPESTAACPQAGLRARAARARWRLGHAGQLCLRTDISLH